MHIYTYIYIYMYYICLKRAQLTKRVDVQGSTITIKSPYVIMYVCQSFGLRGVRW